ncbi:UDP-4-amino-4,6-dideoxy-N-acetyl-beta-L-altrosamine N-acetyltransferase [Virgibacillus sp. W0181]|uniref:UDP-4-amino-4, 6-dideoxy-N-acetyl-beta-L-altrosamine N-acetyltransferase n=1 Tax=Virgibacillus sp. W0181 TaxID=3391581 RepID=UPI003F45D88B
MKYKLQKLSPKYLPIMLQWRNEERIRKSMYNEKVITFDEHMSWYENKSKSNEDVYFVFLIDEEPVGIIYFNRINIPYFKCEWGFYIGKPNSFKGAGTIMGILGLKYAFEELGLNKVYGEVLVTNEGSLKYHEKLGFKKEAYFKQHIMKNDTFKDVIIYGLIKEEWYKDNHDNLVKQLYEKGIDLFGDSSNSSQS